MALPQAPAGYRIVTVKASGNKGTFGTNIKITGLKAAQEGLKAMNVQSVPIIDKALQDIGNVLAIGMDAVKPHQSFQIEKPVIRGQPHARRVSVGLKHPAARSIEFGKKYWWAGFTRPGVPRGSPKGYSMKSGYKIEKEPPQGQKAQPFLGVISGPSVAKSVEGYAGEKLVDAYIKQFEASHAAAGGNNS